jgi:hypothetical protein
MLCKKLILYVIYRKINSLCNIQKNKQFVTDPNFQLRSKLIQITQFWIFAIGYLIQIGHR